MHIYLTRVGVVCALVLLFLVPKTIQKEFVPEDFSLTGVSSAVAKTDTSTFVLHNEEVAPREEVVVPVPKTAVSLAEKEVSHDTRKEQASLRIPSIGVNASVRTMGLDRGKMAVPNNYTEIGWYSLGTAPGEIGNAVFGAHVDSGGDKPAHDGVFKHLKEVSVGDEIVYFSPEGEAIRFRVEATKIYPYNLDNTQEVFGSQGVSKLVLITCHGTWLPSASTYAERLVVFAERV